MSPETVDDVLQRDLGYLLDVSMGRDRGEARRAALRRLAIATAIADALKPHIAVPLSQFVKKKETP